MYLTELTSKILKEKLDELLPEWEVKFSPENLLENSSVYPEFVLTITNRNDKANTYKSCFSLHDKEKSFEPIHLILMNMAAFICKTTKQNELELHQKLFTKVFN